MVELVDSDTVAKSKVSNLKFCLINECTIKNRLYEVAVI